MDLILGSDDGPSPSPERVRYVHLVGIMAFALLLAFARLAFDLWAGFDEISPLMLALGSIVSVSLILISRGRRTTGIDLLFFGVAFASAASFFLFRTDPDFQLDLLSFIDVILFASVIVYGLYAEDRNRMVALFSVAVLFDVASYAFFRAQVHLELFSRIGILILHVIAFDVSRFFRAYVERLNRIAEARRIMNRRLEELIAEVRTAGAERLASLSHDIRSPVTGILGVYDLLSATELTADQKRYLDILGKSNRLLLEIVESILDRQEEPEIGKYRCASIRACLDGALTPYRSVAHSKGVLLRRRIIGDPPPLPLPHADSARVIGNLVDNALKYTDSGRVLVTIGAAGPHGVSLAVSDTGRGMTPERLEAVRAGIAGPDAEVASSCGLGLQSVRRLVACAGGELRIDSAPGKGTKVTIRFPLPEAAPSDILASTVHENSDTR